MLSQRIQVAMGSRLGPVSEDADGTHANTRGILCSPGGRGVLILTVLIIMSDASERFFSDAVFISMPGPDRFFRKPVGSLRGTTQFSALLLRLPPLPLLLLLLLASSGG